MRMNVYAEEMTNRVELVTKEGVIGHDGQPTTFYGIRYYLASPPELHVTEHDDDTSAITFWFRTQAEAGLLRKCLFMGIDGVDVAVSKIIAATFSTASTGTAHNASVATS